MNDFSDRTRDLDEFANASAQHNQPAGGGHALVRPTSGIAERVIGAQPVAVHRDEQRVLQKLNTLAAAAGPDWFYRFPVKKKDGGTDWISGPSIKLANDVARIFGNCAIEVRELDVGDAWTFYARFTDIETGFSMERAYRQRKSQSSMRTRDADRQLDIAYQIGQSKAIRNVICNGLQVYCDYAFEHAQNSLVDKIGKSLEAWRERTLEGLRKMPVELPRVERVVGRASKDWLAPDIARIVAMMRSVADGMASVDEVFPSIAEVASPATGSATASPPHTDEADAQAAGVADSPSQEELNARGPDVQQPQERSPDPGDVYIATAEERGREARRQGLKPKDMPPEYTEPKRGKEAIAWRRGYDGG
jgi:hypothetical protein